MLQVSRKCRPCSSLVSGRLAAALAVLMNVQTPSAVQETTAMDRVHFDEQQARGGSSRRQELTNLRIPRWGLCNPMTVRFSRSCRPSMASVPKCRMPAPTHTLDVRLRMAASRWTGHFSSLFLTRRLPFSPPATSHATRKTAVTPNGGPLVSARPRPKLVSSLSPSPRSFLQGAPLLHPDTS